MVETKERHPGKNLNEKTLILTFSFLFVLVLSGFGQINFPSSLYYKIQAGHSYSFTPVLLRFNSGTLTTELYPRLGGSFSFGTGYSINKWDFEHYLDLVLLDDEMTFLYYYHAVFASASINNIAYRTMSISKNNNHCLRLGLGLQILLPSHCRVTTQNNTFRAKYNPSVGGLLNINWIWKLKKSRIELNPGLEFNVTPNIKNSDITFVENAAKLDKINLSGFKIYLAIILRHQKLFGEK